MKSIFGFLFCTTLSISAFASLNCEINLDDGSGFEMTLTEQGANKMSFRATAVGLYGHCEVADHDLLCQSNSGESIEIGLRSKSFRMENNDGETVRGSAYCN